MSFISTSYVTLQPPKVIVNVCFPNFEESNPLIISGITSTVNFEPLVVVASTVRFVTSI